MKLVSPEHKVLRLPAAIIISALVLKASSQLQTPTHSRKLDAHLQRRFPQHLARRHEWRAWRVLGRDAPGWGGCPLPRAGVTVSESGIIKLKTENASLTQFGVTKSYRSAEISSFFQFRQQGRLF